MAKKLYNPESLEGFKEAKIINGNPNGIINFTSTNLKWAVSLYDIMLSYTWFPQEPNMAADKIPYTQLTADEKNAYDLVLAQLITDDSVQTNQLLDSINPYITAPIVNACLARHAFEESLHSRSYAVMAEDLSANTDRIYNMHKHSPELARKNNAVAGMYEKVNSGEVVTNDDLLLAFAANQVLERLVFPGGFVVMWSLGYKMTSSAKMISFIERDESGTHVPLFKNIFNTVVRQEYGGELPEHIKVKIYEMIEHMVHEEKVWTTHVSKGLLGFSKQAIDMYIEEKANNICDNLHINPLYAKTDGGPLMRIEEKFSLLKSEIKTNFFEQKVADYSVGSLNMDF